MMQSATALSKGNRLPCTQCFSADVTKPTGLTDFDDVRLEPIQMIECAGEAAFLAG
jgi:hypothetical protein